MIAMFCGLEHVIEKTVNRAAYFSKKGYSVIYVSFEITKQRSLNVRDEEVIRAPMLTALDVFFFILLVIRKKPKYIEIYFEGLGINQMFYSLVGVINGTMVVSVFRGGELYYYKGLKFNYATLHSMLSLLVGRISSFVLFREIYMEEQFKKFGYSEHKFFFDYNRVKVTREPLVELTTNNVLFLNGFKEWRRLDLVIDCIPKVVKKVPNVKFTLVGYRNSKEFNSVQRMINELSVQEYVEVFPWTNEPQKYYSNASIFVLPADLIFCNFSLLEAMERGIPAIVSRVKDSERIVVDNYNGLLVNQNSGELANSIIQLLKNRDKLNEFGKNARAIIEKQYNDEKRLDFVFEMLDKKFA